MGASADSVNDRFIEARLQEFRPYLRRAFMFLALVHILLSLALGGYMWTHKTRLSHAALSKIDLQLKSYKARLQRPLSQLTPRSDTGYQVGDLYQLREQAFQLSTDPHSYLMLLDAYGQYIHHPNRERVLTEQDIFKQEAPIFQDALRVAVRTRSPQFREYKQDAETLWLFVQAIPQSEYFLAFTASKDALTQIPHLHQLKIVLLYSLSASFLWLLCVLLKLARLRSREFKLLSGFLSLFLLLNIVGVWYLVLHQTPFERLQQNLLATPTDIHQFKTQTQIKLKAQLQPDVLFIPTGIFIKSLQFQSAETLRITGYAWQKFSNQVQALIPPKDRGLVFSDALETKLSTPFVEDFESYSLQGQSFDIVLNQAIDYNNYPLNTETLSLRVIPPNFSKKIVLVPELEAYNPAFPIGLDTRLRIEGWQIEASGFSYEFYKSPSNFGIGTRASFLETPELILNILIQRQFWGSFTLNLITILLILLLLFGVYAKTTPEFQNHYKPLDIYGPTLALLFNLVLAHFRLRQITISVDKILYVDYFYFIAYAMITLVVFDFTFFSRHAPPLFRYQNSILSKCLYWPLWLSALYAVTLVVFW